MSKREIQFAIIFQMKGEAFGIPASQLGRTQKLIKYAGRYCGLKFVRTVEPKTKEEKNQPTERL